MLVIPPAPPLRGDLIQIAIAFQKLRAKARPLSTMGPPFPQPIADADIDRHYFNRMGRRCLWTLNIFAHLIDAMDTEWLKLEFERLRREEQLRKWREDKR